MDYPDNPAAVVNGQGGYGTPKGKRQKTDTFDPGYSNPSGDVISGIAGLFGQAIGNEIRRKNAWKRDPTLVEFVRASEDSIRMLKRSNEDMKKLVKTKTLTKKDGEKYIKINNKAIQGNKCMIALAKTMKTHLIGKQCQKYFTAN